MNDLTGLKVIAMRDVRPLLQGGASEVLVAEGAVVTPSAGDFLNQNNIKVRRSASSCPAKAAATERMQTGKVQQPAISKTALERLFHSPEAQKIKLEICAVGKKLWNRAYVDGNGGNISYRIGPNEVLCTPTLVSKYDLTPEDICMVDLEGKQLAGIRPRTSEILLHLEIYKEVPEAKAVVHCHPPHATAYAITGRVPPSRIVPEYEVFVGQVAVSPYETPGTIEFARTVLPYVKQHNTVLLGNHGIVCWADTVTHAEWYAEVVDTYCWTLMLATQLGTPISYISHEKAADLLAIKKRLGLPDARFDPNSMKECQLNDLEMPNSIALLPNTCDLPPSAPELDVETVVKAVSDAVMRALNES